MSKQLSVKRVMYMYEWKTEFKTDWSYRGGLSKGHSVTMCSTHAEDHNKWT